MPRTLFRKTNVKIALLLAIAAVSMVVMGVLLSSMQESLSRSSYDTEMEEEASDAGGAAHVRYVPRSESTREKPPKSCQRS